MVLTGLPLGIYTNHWQKTINIARGEGSSCDGLDSGGRCPRAAPEYMPDVHYDLQGIFDCSDIDYFEPMLMSNDILH